MSERLEIKINKKNHSADEPPLEVPSQSKRVEAMRFLLKVDRQTKKSYPSFKVAEEEGLAIKQSHPIVQVAVYDSVDGTNTSIELPKA
jgi:hypothetical protein